MPLSKGSSNKAREKNVREMIQSGHDPKQAEAAAYREQRKSRGKKAHERVSKR